MNASTLTDSEVLATIRTCLCRMREEETELLVLLGEVDARKLYAERAFPSMFAFCVEELGFSEDVTCSRLAVARLARTLPRVLDFVRDGQVHLTGLRLLAPLLTSENLEQVLERASGKSKRQIEELVAELAPRPPVPARIRQLPAPSSFAAPAQRPATREPEGHCLPLLPGTAEPAPHSGPPRPAVVKPLAPQAYRIEFTASARLKAKLEQAEELLRHRVSKGDLAEVFERALDALITKVKKERFGVGRQVRSPAAAVDEPLPPPAAPATRHVPAAIRHQVYERDGGRCTFVSADGRRCKERGGLELDHLDGFARVPEHRADRLTLRCSTHNQLAADRMYGRAFMEKKRRPVAQPTRPGTGEQCGSTRPGTGDSSVRAPGGTRPPGAQVGFGTSWEALEAGS